MKTTDYNDQKTVAKYFKKTLAADFINYPAFLRLLGSIKGKAILDIGCGAGWLAGRLSGKGGRVCAVDSSSRWIKICSKQQHRLRCIKFICADADDLGVFEKGKFDIVTANMVLLCVSSRKKLEKVFAEASRVLKKTGIFVFSDCHPVTNLIGATSTKVSGAVRGFSYFKEGAQYKGTYLLSDYSRIEFIDAHWTLGLYSRLLKKNGMFIEEITEPRPIKIDSRKRFKDYKVPEYIIFKCRKIR